MIQDLITNLITNPLVDLIVGPEDIPPPGTFFLIADEGPNLLADEGANLITP